jgi:hypothetical protein
LEARAAEIVEVKASMNRILVDTADPTPSIFSEARSIQELFLVESRCEQDLYEAAKKGDWREIERLMPMYSDVHVEIMMRLWQAVQPRPGD